MDVCAINGLFARSFTNNVESTAKSFKSWNTCMDNKACKIIAIVGIVLAAITAIWLIGALLTCFRQGVTGIGGFVCWCCNCGQKSARAPTNDGYGKVNPTPATVVYQPIQRPESAYYRHRDDSFYDERKNSKEVFELEQDFDLEKQRDKSKKKRLPAVTHDGDDDLSVYQPSNNLAPSNPWHSFNPQNSNAYQSPYPAEDNAPYQAHNYYHGGYRN
ncbi:Pin2p TDEL_0B03390 [Torulaspora delbrueckii]|uniref:[PSI+] induction protein 2 n=1 Tax=Torulaspora delbrueckii TaxID=4950 RepID=G8ZPC4_TORDE|nr:hypothetical protein TDEL_0B03390 [Torulaspora delbrueckii]CCE90468.1 hypothetical protein TDEL_0B03390 [Torulaspora delbrueckii]